MSNNNYSQFLSRENLSVLFDVITDEYKSFILDKNKFNIAFNEMVQVFYYNQIKNGPQNVYDIVNMNKKFIIYMSDVLEKKYNINKRNNVIKNNMVPTPITNEDIKNERLDKFDKELNLKQNEFKSAFNQPIPDTPNFKSPLDKPIIKMDILTQQKIEERENEIQSIYNNIQNNIKNNKNDIKKQNKEDFELNESNNWLQYFSAPVENKESAISNIMKSIKIKEEVPKSSIIKEEFIELQQNTYMPNVKKNISWSDELNTNENIEIIIDENDDMIDDKESKTENSLFTNNILTKLKKINNDNISEEVLPIESSLILTNTNTNTNTNATTSNLDDSESIKRLENKIDKLTNDLNKCYDVIALLFNNLMSSPKLMKTTISTETNTEPNSEPNTEPNTEPKTEPNTEINTETKIE